MLQYVNISLFKLIADAGAGLNDETTSEVLYKMSNNYTKEESDIF